VVRYAYGALAQRASHSGSLGIALLNVHVSWYTVQLTSAAQTPVSSNTRRDYSPVGRRVY